MMYYAHSCSQYVSHYNWFYNITITRDMVA